MSWGRHRKVQNLICSSFKRSYKNNKNGNKGAVTISYKMKFIGSAIFIASLLSNIGDNLTEEIHKSKCKDYGCFFQYKSVKGNLIKYKFLSYNKDYWKKLYKELKKWFKNTFKFSNNDINIFFC